MSSMTIGQVAKQSDFGVETIRFYEREGLIEEPPRRPSGYRQYPDSVILRLRFIRQAKELGFSLSEIRELLSLRVEPRARCGGVKRLAEAKTKDIEVKIASLQRMRRVLRKLTTACDEREPTGECPILEALGRDGA